MVPFREVSDWRKKKAYIQRSGDRIFTTNEKMLIVNDSNILRCMIEAGLNKEDLNDGLVYRFGFENGSRHYKGFGLEDQKRVSEWELSGFFKELKVVGVNMKEVDVPSCFDDDRGSLVGLASSDGAGFLVDRRYHDYIKRTTGSDGMVAAAPTVYTLKGKAVATLAQFDFFWNNEGRKSTALECLDDIYEGQGEQWTSWKLKQGVS